MRIQLLCLMQLEMKQLHIWLAHDTFTQLLSPLHFPLLCVWKCVHFHPANDSFLITGGLHLLRGISRYCCRFAHDHRDCYSHRPLLPICEDPLDPALSREVVICVVSFKSRRLFSVTQQVPWLHMLYAAIGAIIYTLVGAHIED